jgi:hypothetical protein
MKRERISRLLLVALDRVAPNLFTSISILIMVNLGLAHIMLLSLGGTLVDLLDRRKAMMALDFLGAFVTFGCMIAIERNSLVLFYNLSAAAVSDWNMQHMLPTTN